MKIAICDDELQDLKTIQEIIAKHYNTLQLDLSFFHSALDLYQSHEKVSFDLVILDIEMPEPNGFEIANRLNLLQPSPLIIFVTQSMEYTVAGYGVAFRYIPKCRLEELLIPAMDKAFEELEHHFFDLEYDGITSMIPIEEITYIEVYNHNVTLHTLREQISFRDSISNVFSKLPQKAFGMPHQSYIVHFAHVSKLTSCELHLTSGTVIPISRRRSQKFNQAFHKYLGR